MEGERMVSVYERACFETFSRDVYPKRLPAVLRGLNLGPATQTWSADYLKDKVGKRNVKLHLCPTERMDFVSRNFVYKTLPFDEFITRASRSIQSDYFICKDEKYYLRSLGDDPRKNVAKISTQFPELAADIVIPELFPHDKLFSSVFRVGSAGIHLWTHYDTSKANYVCQIMDNLLIQVTGRKRVVLFSPRDALNLYLVGDKSAVLNIDEPDLTKYPLFSQAVKHTCYIEPGDVLFIPALWFHNVVSLDFSVAVNVFWKHLEDKFYDPKDTYGNKDLIPAARAFQIGDRAVKALQELPDEYCDFFARLLVSQIQAKCFDLK